MLFPLGKVCHGESCLCMQSQSKACSARQVSCNQPADQAGLAHGMSQGSTPPSSQPALRPAPVLLALSASTWPQAAQNAKVEDSLP